MRPAGKFQSTRPRGARPVLVYPVPDSAGVSIHAPAWGATCECRADSSGSRSFNPRARVGRDFPGRAGSLPRQQFQSTRPRGARPPITAIVTRRQGFNPRARVGRDFRYSVTRYAMAVSIHAPAWGATHCQTPVVLMNWFQSTRPRGARPWPQRAIHLQRTVSIHAPAWGATLICVQHPGLRKCFNPRARVGRDDQHEAAPGIARARFNPRARVGRDSGVITRCARGRKVGQFAKRRRRGTSVGLGGGWPIK